MKQLHSIIECMLFVAGDPVPIDALAQVLALSRTEAYELLAEMEAEYRRDARGILLLVTDEAAQLTSNRDYVDYVEKLVQPEETRTVSQSLMETLAVIAYRQPVTRADVEKVRGVRCDYAVSQLQRLGLIAPAGRKDAVGRPVLYATTDRFLRQFGLHNVAEMPEYLRFSAPAEMEKRDTEY